MNVGVHCSIRKGLLNAITEINSLGCRTMQIFTRSPRGWYTRKISNTEITEFRNRRAQYGINPLVVHVPYLPNPASSDEKLFNKTLKILTDDLLRAWQIQADYLVIHPGAYSIDSTVQEGLERIVLCISRALCNARKKLPVFQKKFKVIRSLPVLLLENVSGGGRRLGSKFEELRFIIERIKRDCRSERNSERISMDNFSKTGNTAAGCSTQRCKTSGALPGGLRQVELDEEPLGSGLRHLETPKDSPSHDRENVRRVKALAAGQPLTGDRKAKYRK